MRKVFGLLAVMLIGILLLGACSSIDCPSENLVLAHYRFHSANGDSLVLRDSVSVISWAKDGEEITVLNKTTDRASFYLPVSYSHPEDLLVFDFTDGKVHTYDTVWVKKEDIPHFESVDCNAKFFHRLTSVRNTTHYIDSVVIKNPYVDFNNATVHFYVYPKDTD